jgi:hypothetical protein
MFRSLQNIAVGDRIAIISGRHIYRFRTVVKVLPRSYYVKFDILEKLGETTLTCVHAWNIKKLTPLMLSPPDTITSHGGSKKKLVNSVCTNEIAQVMLPVLKSMPLLTKYNWIVIAQAVKKLFFERSRVQS